MVRPERNYVMPRFLTELKERIKMNTEESTSTAKCSCVRSSTTSSTNPCCCSTNKTFGGNY